MSVVVALVVVVVMMMFGVGAVGVFSAGRQRTEEWGGSGPARFIGNEKQIAQFWTKGIMRQSKE